MEDTLLLDETLALLNNDSKDISFMTAAGSNAKDKKNQRTLDITFAGGNENQKGGQKTSSSSQRSSLVSRKSKGSALSGSSRARWSLPSDESLNDGLTVSERYA